MTSNEGNKPAFPAIADRGVDNAFEPFYEAGISQRLYIATAALQGLLANSESSFLARGPETWAELALEQADALLAAAREGESDDIS